MGGACDLEGSGERIDMGWNHRVWSGTALELLEKSRRLVRVTTANGCFMAPRPADTASGLLVIDGSCGRRTRLGQKLTPSGRPMSSTGPAKSTGLDLRSFCISADYSLNSKLHDSTPGLTTQVLGL